MRRATYVPVIISILSLLVASCSTSRKSQSNEEKAQAYLEVANAALTDGDPTGALKHLFEAEKYNPKNAEIYHSKALAFFAKQDLAAALIEAKHAVELNPQYSDANATLGKLLVDAGKYDEARPPLLAAAEDPLYRSTFKPLTNLGIIQYRKGDFAGAKKYFDRAITVAGPNACVAYFYRGHLSLRDSRFSEAIQDYGKATQGFCANFGDAHLALGLAYERNKQFDLARRKFIEVEERYPNSKFSEKAMSRLRGLP